MKGFDVCLVEVINFKVPQIVITPFLALHLQIAESKDVVLNKILGGLTDRLEVPGIYEFRLGNSDNDLVELKPAKGSVSIVHHVKELDVGGNKKSVHYTHWEILVNYAPLYELGVDDLQYHRCFRSPSTE